MEQKGLTGGAGPERVDCRALGGRWRMPRRRGNRPASEWIARRHLVRDLDDAAIDQAPQHRRRKAQVRGEMLDRHASAERFEQLEQRAPPRRTGELAVAVEQRRKLAAKLCDPASAPRRLGCDVRRERRRQRAAHGDADRHDIVFRHPRAEREHPFSEHWLVVRQRVYGLGSDRRARRRGADDDADLPPIAKRNDGPHPRTRARDVRVVDLVGESAEERQGEGDIDEHDGKLMATRRPIMIASLRSTAAAAALFAAVCAVRPAQARGQAPLDPLAAKVHAYRTAHDVDIVREFADLLAIPNLARDSANIHRNAERVIEMLGKRGISGRLLDGPAGAPPAVYGELRTPGATRTIVLYAHYDGQPVETTQWITPPWQPVLRDKPADAGGKVIPLPTSPGSMQGEWRLYARSAGDDKAPIEAMLAALDALRAAGVSPSVNLKFFFEGEEEAGSPHVAEILRRNAPLLAADAWLFCDGPVHQSRRQQLVFGVRGVTGAEITVYGPSHGLHSGHYGNWAPNPVTLLANLIASMRDDDGKILIRSFYDDVAPVTAAEHAAASSAPPVDSALRSEVQLAATEARDAPLVDRIMLPALNLRGIRGGGVGATASNTIPTEATASLDFRLVPRQTPEHLRALVEAHVRSRGYFIVDHDPTRAERMAH